MMQSPNLTFLDGQTYPQLGYGTYKISESEMPECIDAAVKAGYRHFDTAAIYKNEAAVGDALRASGLDRGDFKVTTKIWNDRQGYDETLRAFEESFDRLGLGAPDLLLIHWPVPESGLYVETWKAFIELRDQGKVASIGVSNFMPEHLKRLVDDTGVVPCVNQIELHPTFQQRDAVKANAEHGVITESWSPIGQGAVTENQELIAIGAAHGKSAVQAVLRWHLQSGFIVIPKSTTPSRIADNFDIFDFELSDDEMARIDAMDTEDGRLGPDPMTFS